MFRLKKNHCCPGSLGDPDEALELSNRSSEWTDLLRWSLAAGKVHHIPRATIMMLGLREVPSLVAALGFDRTMALLSTWFAQCSALAKAEEVILVGGLSSAVRIECKLINVKSNACSVQVGLDNSDRSGVAKVSDI